MILEDTFFTNFYRFRYGWSGKEYNDYPIFPKISEVDDIGKLFGFTFAFPYYVIIGIFFFLGLILFKCLSFIGKALRFVGRIKLPWKDKEEIA